MRRIKSGSTIAHLNQKDFLDSMPKPEEQSAISTILSDMDTEILTLQKHLGKTRKIK